MLIKDNILLRIECYINDYFQEKITIIELLINIKYLLLINKKK